MSLENEVERLVVKILGDGSAYKKMIDGAIADTKKFEEEQRKLAAEEAKAAKVQQAHARVLEHGADVTRSVETATERYGRETKDLSNLLRRGAISQTTYNRALLQQRLELGRNSGAFRVAKGLITGVGSSLRIAATAASGFVLAITGIGALAVREFSQFQSSLSKIEGLVGLSSKQVQAFKGDIRDIAKLTGEGPSELADAMFQITSAGLRGADAIAALKASAMAAAAGLGETATVADAVTSAMNAYGPAVLNAQRATDVLVAAVREGKASADSFAPVLGRVLPLANELGVSFGETAGAIAFLTKATGDAATAATNVRGIMVQLLKPTDGAEKAFEKLGINAEQLREVIRTRGLEATLIDLRRELERHHIPLSQVFTDTEALTGALQLTGPAAKDAQKVIESVTGSVGIASEAFGKGANTIERNWNQALANVNVKLGEIGEKLAPTFTKVVNIVSGVIEESSPQIIKFAEDVAAKFSKIVEDAPKLVTSISTAVKGFVAAAQPVVDLLIEMATTTKAILDSIAIIEQKTRSARKAVSDANAATGGRFGEAASSGFRSALGTAGRAIGLPIPVLPTTLNRSRQPDLSNPVGAGNRPLTFAGDGKTSNKDAAGTRKAVETLVNQNAEMLRFQRRDHTPGAGLQFNQANLGN